jgi:hypothetical protein
MHWPQIVYLCLVSIALCISFIKHGRPCGKYSFPATAIAYALLSALLYAGGFFGGT